MLTNATQVAARLEKLDVVDAADPSRVLVSYSGKKLVDPECPGGDCNRLRTLPASQASDDVIPPQESRALYVDFKLDSLDEAPAFVLHHVYARAAANPAAREPERVDYVVTPFNVAAGSPRVIAPPLRGSHWVALNGCCLPGFPHRSSLAPLNGMLVNSQRFAIDWKRLNDVGEFYAGDPIHNESYVDYGEPIYAVADGPVVSTLDSMDANTPGVLPADDPVLAPQLNVHTVDGNHIVQDLGDGVFAFYAHLQRGSLLVEPGDHVRKGQVIAKLGNTGNSNAPHLHFHLMNDPSPLGGDGLPYVIDGFEYDGQIFPEDLDTDDFLTGEFFRGRLPAPEPRTDELPLAWAIVNFPE